MRGWSLAAVLLLAGCAAVPLDEEPSDLPRLMVAMHAVGGDVPDLAPAEDGLLMDFNQVVSFAGRCIPRCAPLSIGPAGPVMDMYLDIRLHWDGTTAPPPGNDSVQVTGPSGHEASQPRRGFDTLRTVVWPILPHWHELHMEGEVAGTIALRSPEVPMMPGELRPNLVTLTPVHPVVAECRLDESVEDEAVRCLRLGNSVGNVGDGPMEVHLGHADGALSAAGQGRFVQRVYAPDGHRDVPASNAEFHPIHGHFHYAGLAHFELYEVRGDGLRGDLVATGHKRGFCFLDWGDMESPEAPAQGGHRAEQDCLVPDPARGWSMGISRGFYDYYWAELADQYIDIQGVPDGTYELVSIADGAGTLLETDETDNVASLVVHLEKDSVRILEERSLYDNPEA